MNVLTFKAHYDGERLWLDEPLDLPRHKPLLLALLEPGEAEHERADWAAFAKGALARAYGDNEPDYPAELVRKKPTQ